MNNVYSYVPKGLAVEAIRWDGKNQYIRESAFQTLSKRNLAFAYTPADGSINVFDKKGNEHMLSDGYIVFDGHDTAFTMSDPAFKEFYVRLEDPF